MIRILLILCIFAQYANAQTIRSYDVFGHPIGSEQKSGNTTRFYDQSGKYIGRSEQIGNTIRYYDSNGRLIKSETR